MEEYVITCCVCSLQILFVLSIVAYTGLEVDGYQFPAWSEAIGWLLTSSSLVFIPLGVGVAYFRTSGSPSQVGQWTCMAGVHH